MTGAGAVFEAWKRCGMPACRPAGGVLVWPPTVVYIVEPEEVDAVHLPWIGDDVCKLGSIGLTISLECGLEAMEKSSGRIAGSIRVAPAICFPCAELTLVFPHRSEESPERQVDTRV